MLIMFDLSMEGVYAACDISRVDGTLPGSSADTLVTTMATANRSSQVATRGGSLGVDENTSVVALEWFV